MSQTICAITPLAAGSTYSGYSFVLAVGGNGFAAGELAPTTTTTPFDYQVAFPSNLQASGTFNTCFTFLPNLGPAGTDTTTAANAPYWFLMGAESTFLYLGQINPSPSAPDFSGANIPDLTRVSYFDSVPVGLCYVAALQMVYVATANGNLYSYEVVWSESGTPTLGYVSANKNFDAAGSGAVSIVADTDNNLYVSGLTAGNGNATYVIPATAGSTPLGNGSPIANTSNSIATAIADDGLYTAFAGSLSFNAFGSFTTAQNSVWTTPGGVTITAIAWSPNAAQAGGVYPQGVLFIATSDASIYAYDPSTGSVSLWQAKTVPGAPHGMIADQNMNVLVQFGDAGVYFASMVAQEGLPATATLVAANGGSGANLGSFAAVEQLVFKLVVNDVENAIGAG